MPLPTTKRGALELIIRDSEQMRDLAASAGEDFLAYLLENVLHEARATLIAAGHEPPTRAPLGRRTIRSLGRAAGAAQ